MKKYSIIAIILLLAISLSACGRKMINETTPSTMEPTIIPPTTILDPTIMDPTLETNIPDPEVDSNSTDSTDNTVARNRTGMNIR